MEEVDPFQGMKNLENPAPMDEGDEAAKREAEDISGRDHYRWRREQIAMRIAGHIVGLNSEAFSAKEIAIMSVDQADALIAALDEK